MTRINDLLQVVVGWLVAMIFAGLIGVVALQVLARNVLALPLIWTLDVAQLLFSWCIFLGAGLAFRHGAHYTVDLWPSKGSLRLVPVFIGILAGLVVVYVLVWHGIEMVELSARRRSQSLGISHAWYFAPIPLCGVIIGLAVLEQILLRREQLR